MPCGQTELNKRGSRLHFIVPSSNYYVTGRKGITTGSCRPSSQDTGSRIRTHAWNPGGRQESGRSCCRGDCIATSRHRSRLRTPGSFRPPVAHGLVLCLLSAGSPASAAKQLSASDFLRHQFQGGRSYIEGRPSRAARPVAYSGR